MKWLALAGGLAFYASLVTHAALMLYLLRHDLKTFWLYLPPLPRFADGLFVQVDEQETPLRHRIGEETGKGFGSHQSYGPDLLYAWQGPQDQAWLSRDPAGPGLDVREPSRNTAIPQDLLNERAVAGPIGVSGAGQELIAPTVGPPAQLVELLLTAPPEPITMGPADDRPAGTQPIEQALAIPVAAETSAPSDASPDATSQAGAQPKARGGDAAGPAADPAPESDSESDAFARIGSIQFKNGKLDVRLGRKVKTVKPRFTIKGGLDLISLVDPVTVVMVSISDTGKVSHVRVIRSSGSNELDLPWVLAVYKWWFEPAKDAAGKPTSDIIQLSLGVIDLKH